MTNKQIFKKAILKAEKNGYDAIQWYPILLPKGSKRDLLDKILYSIKEKIIFSHSFAKAFWGTEWKDGDIISLPLSEAFSTAELDNIKMWQYHLKKMVLEKKPLKYLEKFLDYDTSNIRVPDCEPEQ